MESNILVKVSLIVTCPAPRRHTAKRTKSDRESIATLEGPNICTLTLIKLRKLKLSAIEFRTIGP